MRRSVLHLHNSASMALAPRMQPKSSPLWRRRSRSRSEASARTLAVRPRGQDTAQLVAPRRTRPASWPASAPALRPHLQDAYRRPTQPPELGDPAPRLAQRLALAVLPSPGPQPRWSTRLCRAHLHSLQATTTDRARAHPPAGYRGPARRQEVRTGTLGTRSRRTRPALTSSRRPRPLAASPSRCAAACHTPRRLRTPAGEVLCTLPSRAARLAGRAHLRLAGGDSSVFLERCGDTSRFSTKKRIVEFANDMCNTDACLYRFLAFARSRWRSGKSLTSDAMYFIICV